jgi:hypothetical protein
MSFSRRAAYLVVVMVCRSWVHWSSPLLGRDAASAARSFEPGWIVYELLASITSLCLATQAIIAVSDFRERGL